MISLEKSLILRYFSFLKNDEILILSQNFSEKELYGINQDQLEECLKKKFSRKIHLKKIYPKVIHTQEYLIEKTNISYVTWEDSRYPFLLKKIYDPPFILFYQGTLPTHPSLSVVGSRKAPIDAIMQTRHLGRSLGSSNISVISGLALGIDTAVHQGVVESKGKAFSILATSVDNIYPKENRSLSQFILSFGGGILSETPPQEVIGRYSFAKRNRIISGLSQATLVMYAPLKSGSLITAQSALEQGREVYMWDNPLTGEGNLKYLEEGANSYKSIKDLEPILGKINNKFYSQEEVQESHKKKGDFCAEKCFNSVEDLLVSNLLEELGI